MILVFHGLVVSVFLYAFCSWTNGQQSEKAQYGMSEKILPLPHKVKTPKKKFADTVNFFDKIKLKIGYLLHTL